MMTELKIAQKLLVAFFAGISIYIFFLFFKPITEEFLKKKFSEDGWYFFGVFLAIIVFILLAIII